MGMRVYCTIETSGPADWWTDPQIEDLANVAIGLFQTEPTAIRLFIHYSERHTRIVRPLVQPFHFLDGPDWSDEPPDPSVFDWSNYD